WMPLLGLWLVAVPVRSLESATPQQHEKLRRAIEELRRQQEQTRAEKDGISIELEQLERQIGTLAAGLRDLMRRQQALQQQHETLIAEKRERARELESIRRQLAALVRGAYFAGREERLKLLLNQEDPALISRILAYHDYLARARVRKLEQVRRHLDEVERLSSDIQRQQYQLQQLAGEQLEKKRMLEARNRERKSVLARLQRQLRDQGERLQRMKEDEQRLARLIEQAQRALSVLQLPERQKFAQRRGKLSWPLKGRLLVLFGADKIGDLRWDGVIIKAPEGREVRAIHSGRVAYADWLRGYGLLIILDHGDGYMSLYGHNQGLFKETGDWVNAGEVIGLAGRSGGIREAGIYFGIRHKGEAVDPVRWCRSTRGRNVG
ncbi:MAG TPA: peptidase M23, partial [Chromatiaceae bacterium]|nr:peptidase M23 [Chromatiaceae bacterium]